MSRLASILTGRRSKWAVVAVWIVVAFVLAPIGGKLGDVTDSQTQTFLPKDAESTTVLNLLKNRFSGGDTVNGLIVYQAPGGFTAADKAVAADAKAAQAKLPLVGKPVVPFTSGANAAAAVAPGGTVAITSLSVPDNQDKLGDWGDDLHDITSGSPAAGMKTYVTGDLGFNRDINDVFSSLDTTLLLATVLLVLVLLGAIYRAPLIALIPLVVVGFAYMCATGLIYLYAKSGATVSDNATGILIVLMFGVGTDYCLLLVSRYREELRSHDDKHEAMHRAISRAGPAMIASGVTVTLSMLVLLLADVGSTRTLGPVAAIGVFTCLLAGVTLLPALLTIGGRRAFWPRRQLIAFSPGDTVAAQGLWRRVGDRVLQRPGRALGVTLGVFLIAAVGLVSYKVDYSSTSFFKKDVESVDGFKVIESALPAGLLDPSDVLIERPGGAPTKADVAAAEKALGDVDGVASVTPSGRSTDHRIVRLSVILSGDPNDSAGLDVVPRMRSALADLPSGATGLVGGSSAINYDFDKANKSDLRLVAPLALLAIAIILGVLLSSVVAPLVLIASVITSFLGTIGVSMLFIRYVVGDTGINSSLPTFAFIFLVALGIDYTIFLMSRVREEARTHGTREGMLRALAATGPVITSAGIILAGTFSVLITLPVTFTFDLGFMVALGILLDTFIVRTIMVPAAVELIGDRIWWPSTAKGGTRLFRDEADSSVAHGVEPQAE